VPAVTSPPTHCTAVTFAAFVALMLAATFCLAKQIALMQRPVNEPLNPSAFNDLQPGISTHLGDFEKKFLGAVFRMQRPFFLDAICMRDAPNSTQDGPWNRPHSTPQERQIEDKPFFF